MNKTDIMNIEMGDYFYVDKPISKRFFDSKPFLAYKPNKFYRIISSLQERLRGNGDDFKIVTSSEIGRNTMFVIKKNEAPIYMKHFTIVKQSDYKEVKNVEFFEDLQ